jgi:hypothetical protein
MRFLRRSSQTVASRFLWLTISTLALACAAPTSRASGLRHRPSLDVLVGPGAIRSDSAEDDAANARVGHIYGQLPLSFEANLGQTDPQVDFLARGPGYTVFLTPSQMVLSLSRKSEHSRRSQHPGKTLGSAVPRQLKDERQRSAVLRMMLEGANRRAKVSTMKPLPGKVHYLLGNDPTRWRTEIPTYSKATYQDVYPNIDLVYYGNQQQLEYDFIVYPGSSPDAIRLRFEGADRMEVDGQGDLLLHTSVGVVRKSKPRIYQTLDGRQQQISGRYVLQPPSLVGFEIDQYDLSQPLVIDPTLVYSTYLGGSADDYALEIGVDASGSAYVTGFTRSVDFPTSPGAFDATVNGATEDVFVTKLDPAGAALVYSTYLGGTATDIGTGIAVDSAGSAYVTGSTFSADFPSTPGAFDTSLNSVCAPECVGLDAFVVKLNATGSALLYSSYLGGSHNDFGDGIAVDAGGNAYLTGATSSADFPTTPVAFDTSFNSYIDAFVTKFNVGGSSLVYSTYLGGEPADPIPPEAVGAFGFSIAVDAAGNAYVTGPTDSPNFPTTAGAFDTSFNGAVDTFVTKLDAAGASLAYSTYLGGSSEDYAQAIAVDSAGSAYVTGYTSAEFPTTQGAFATTLRGSYDAFVAKIHSDGTLLYSTYLGGLEVDLGFGIAVDASGNAYVTGQTRSPDFPTTPGAFDGNFNDADAFAGDAFVTKFNAAGSAILYSTYVGGTNSDFGEGIAVDAAGSVYITGHTLSSDFPTTPNAYDRTFNGTSTGTIDAFVLKIGNGFAGVPKQADCHGKSVSALNRQFGNLPLAATALGFPSVHALQRTIQVFCEGD